MNFRFNPPPNWPVPEGWTPPQGWSPPSDWPAPPHGWILWVPAGDEKSSRQGRARVWMIVGAICAVLLLVLVATRLLASDGPDADSPSYKVGYGMAQDFYQTAEAAGGAEAANGRKYDLLCSSLLKEAKEEGAADSSGRQIASGDINEGDFQAGCEAGYKAELP